MNSRGKLVSLEGAEAFAAIANRNLKGLGLDNSRVEVGRFAETLPSALNAMRPVDFIFIDGHHDRDATIKYFDQARPFLAPQNVIVFDDIDWSDGMREAWSTIKRSTNGHSLGNVGVCIDVQ